MKTCQTFLLAFLAFDTQAIRLKTSDEDLSLDEIDDSSISSLTEKAHEIVSKKVDDDLHQKLNKLTNSESDSKTSTNLNDNKKQETSKEQEVDKSDSDNKTTEEKSEVKKEDDKTAETSKQNISAKDFEMTTEENTEETKPAAEEKSDDTDKPASSNLIKIKKLLTETSNEEFVSEILSRKDGLNHLLLSDVNILLQSIAHDFPEIATLTSMGKSYQGRDINVIELKTSSGGQSKSEEKEAPKETEKVQTSESAKPKEDDELVQLRDNGASKPAVLMTGATHARELISTSINLYEMLKLIKEGHINKDPKYQELLDKNRYMFAPILNVDGVAKIEEGWEKNHKIIPHRKNYDSSNSDCLKNNPDENLGVDINRNFGIDFGQVDEIVKYQVQNYNQLDENDPNRKDPMKPDPCDYNYPGPAAFSEPESQAYRNYLTKNQNDLAFVMNVHSNGNAFIYPFNGRQKNDIEQRRPGIMNIFTEISNKAPFPQGTMKGTSKELMGIAIGGDQDDWTLDALGIPSVTAEVGYVGQFIDEWRVKDSSTANDIMREQSPWIEYVYKNAPKYHEIIESHRKK